MNKFISRSIFMLIISILAVGIVSAQDEVIMQLSWIYNSSTSSFFLAQDQGYYEDFNLDVNIRSVFDEEGNRYDMIEEVVSGRAQFGFANQGLLLQARADGIPIVAIAAFYQRNPVTFASLEDQDIQTPQDLIGKTVSVSNNAVIMLHALFKVLDIDPSEVDIQERTDFSLDPFLDGEVDVTDMWVTNEIALLTAQGTNVNIIYPFEYGIDMYANLIFTSEDMIENNPEVVAAFLEATLMGIDDTVDDPDLAVAALMPHGDDFVLDEITEGLYRAIPLLAPTGSASGMMDPEIWEIGYEILQDEGLLEGDVDLESAYTMEFLDAIYGDS